MVNKEEIRKALDAATPGPWKWVGNTAAKQVRLCTNHSGEYFVMGFDRWGMQSAVPTFQDFEKFEGPVDERGSLGMYKADKWMKPRASHHREFNLDIDHPDAHLIANAPTWLRTLLEERQALDEQADFFRHKFQQLREELEQVKKERDDEKENHLQSLRRIDEKLDSILSQYRRN